MITRPAFAGSKLVHQPEAAGTARCKAFWLAAALSVLLSGCTTFSEHSLTCQLWTNSDFRTFNQPAPQPKLALFATGTGNKVLVQYDSVSDWQANVKRKAYFLDPDQAALATRTKPRFVKLSEAEGLKPIPVFSGTPEATNAPIRPIPHAVAATNSGRFTLYAPGGSAKTIGLPVYVEHSGTPTRVALTPLAVVGDTLVVAAVAAFVTAVELCRGNFSFRP